MSGVRSSCEASATNARCRSIAPATASAIALKRSSSRRSSDGPAPGCARASIRPCAMARVVRSSSVTGRRIQRASRLAATVETPSISSAPSASAAHTRLTSRRARPAGACSNTTPDNCASRPAGSASSTVSGPNGLIVGRSSVVRPDNARRRASPSSAVKLPAVSRMEPSRSRTRTAAPYRSA